MKPVKAFLSHFKCLGAFATLVLFIPLSLTAQDLPGTVTPNIQTAPVGTIVIPFDNDHQMSATTPARYNLKAYGLAVSLLYNEYPIKWVIRTGKAHDAIDFSVAAERVTPSFIATASQDFRSSALLIFPADTLNIFTRIIAFNSTLPAGYAVKVYRTTAPVAVDVRYNLNVMPRVGILSDGANQAIHLGFLTAASIPASNYSVFSATTLGTECFTFAAEPHLSSFGPWNAAARSYVNQGGNLLFQCAAIETYENSLFGQYQSSTGMATTNVAITNVSYNTPDMAFGQFHGAFNPSNGGTVQNWQFNLAGAQLNNAYKVIGNANNSAHIGASVAKVGAGLGGLVFFIGNHTFSPNSQDEVNGIRMFLNAMLIPSGWQCDKLVWYIMPIKLQSFSFLEKSETGNRIQWTGNEENSENGFYILEHSADGKHFTTLFRTQAKNYGVQTYQYRHDNLKTGKNFYRLRMEQVKGKIEYSEQIVAINYAEEGLTIYPNPARTTATLSFTNKKNTRYSIQVADMTGRTVKKLTGQTVDHVISLPVSDLLPGTYLVSVRGSDGSSHHNKMVVGKN